MLWQAIAPIKCLEVIMDRYEYVLDNQTWYMKQMNPGQGIEQELYDIPPERDIAFSGWHYATIPGDVYSDLQRAGVIEDPYIGRNMVKQAWVQYYEWWYICRFNVPKDFKEKDLQLIFGGIDYSCEIWLNGHRLGKHEGMYSPIKFDVTGLLKTYLDADNASECCNHLVVKLDPPPQTLHNIAGLHHTFSGDYLPGFIPVGIWRSVKIVAYENARIEDLYVHPTLTDAGAILDLTATLELKAAANADYDVVITVSDEDTNIVTKTTERFYPGSNDITAHIGVPEPKLWWPWDMGDQPLYYATVEVYENGRLLDTAKTRFGIREVKMAFNPGFTLDECETPWTFVINGKPIFLRSGCWGGPPSFLYGRNSRKKYEHLLNLAKYGNFNNLRIFGWHPPEVDDFYDICDELGITTWTNFPLSSQVLRDDPPYVNAVLHECGEIVKERRNHPCNIFWMGGEEVFFSEAQVRSHNKRMMKEVGIYIKRYTDIPYADASMMSSAPARKLGYKPKECLHYNGAYYAAGRTAMEDYFANPLLECAIVPELCGAAVPNLESLKKFIPADEIWPPGPSWGYLMANIDILKAINMDIFGDQCYDSIENFIDSTQKSQGEVYKFAIEFIRRKKPHMSGVALCHFITNRPLMKWEIVDYYGVPKQALEYVRKAYAPLVPSVEYRKRRFMPGEEFKAGVWVLNDTYNKYQDLTCKISINYSDGKVDTFTENIAIVAENTNAKFFEISSVVSGEVFDRFTIYVELYNGDEVIASNDYFLLVDDQEEAKNRKAALYQTHREKTLKYGKTLYRDFPEVLELD